MEGFYSMIWWPEASDHPVHSDNLSAFYVDLITEAVP